jgi:transcriptional regulator with PAS, ATPase and Fis domain
MGDNKIRFKIFSDERDTSSIESILERLELQEYEIKISIADGFSVAPNEILIFQPVSIESKLIKKLFENKKKYKNKVLFVVNGSNAVLISSLAKLGFNNIFVLPYELFKLTDYIQEIIINKLYITESKVKPSFGSDIHSLRTMVGSSSNFMRVIDLAKKVSDNKNVNVLILGETGTGKGLLARAIHNYGQFNVEPFVEIVCTAIPETLLESELFGYEPGAFTHAETRKQGLFELADNGTLFLDEIGDLSLGLQAKLLRPIEKKIIRRLGGVDDIPLNARLISATNKNLSELVENHLFRRDLYHRLNVVSLEIPPLRSRGNDIILLANAFIEEYNSQFDKNVKGFDSEVKQFFLNYNWPGNVREFRNSLERAILLTDESKLKLKHFTQIINKYPVSGEITNEADSKMPHIIRMELNYMDISINQLTKRYVLQLLEKTRGNKSRAAKILGISRPRLERLLKLEK